MFYKHKVFCIYSIIKRKEAAEMKKTRLGGLLLGGILLAGLWAGQMLAHSRLAQDGTEMAAAGDGCLEPISSDSVSQAVYDDLQAEWDFWNMQDETARLLSSHSPGFCQRAFDDWAECEGFLGFSIPNPLEECAWLEQATYVGMPVGFRDAPHVQAYWYGTEDGHIEWISVEAGYRIDQIRVMVEAAVYGDPADQKSSDSGWGTELARQSYLADAEHSPLQVTADCTERYFSTVAYQAQGPVLYRFNLVGDLSAQTQVENTLAQVVAFFFAEEQESAATV